MQKLVWLSHLQLTEEFWHAAFGLGIIMQSPHWESQSNPPNPAAGLHHPWPLNALVSLLKEHPADEASHLVLATEALDQGPGGLAVLLNSQAKQSRLQSLNWPAFPKNLPDPAESNVLTDDPNSHQFSVDTLL